jgi:hypothetical protein
LGPISTANIGETPDARRTHAAEDKTNLAPANDVIVLSFCTGEHRDQLIISQHRYFQGVGSFDWYWLYDSTGQKELGPVGDENES